MANNEEALVMNSEGYMVQREYGKDEGTKEYKNYAEAVDDLIEMKSTLEHQFLELNWNIGRQAYLVKSGSSYGGHDVTELADDLDMSPSSVYTAIKFYETYTLDDVRRMNEENIPFRRAIALMKLQPQDRDQIEGLLVDHRLSDDNLKKIIQNAENGVVIPDDPTGQRAYVEKIKNGDSFNDEPDDEDDDDDEETEVIDAGDPTAKFRANLQTSVDQMSLSLSEIDQMTIGMLNTMKGEVYNNLNQETKESMRGMLSGLAKEISKTINRAYQLMRMLPQPQTKEADTNAEQ